MTRATRTGDSETTVDGRFVRAVIDGVVEACGHFEDRTRRLLAEQGIEDPGPGTEHDLSGVVEAIWAIHRTTGRNTVNRIGRAVSGELAWIGNVDDIWAAFERLDSAYRRIHAGADIGRFQFESDPEGGRLRVDTPYPAAFERGLIRGIGRRFGSDTGYIAIENERSTGGSDATNVYELVWWDDRPAVKKISVPSDRPPEPTAGRQSTPAD